MTQLVRPSIISVPLLQVKWDQDIGLALDKRRLEWRKEGRLGKGNPEMDGRRVTY